MTRWLAAGLLLLLLLLQSRLWWGDGSVSEVLQLQSAVERQSRENAELDERNRALAGDVADLRSGSDAVEERARQDLGMIGADEHFYRVIESDAQ